eukprot:4794786-Prymnesium_polylepis.1
MNEASRCCRSVGMMGSVNCISLTSPGPWRNSRTLPASTSARALGLSASSPSAMPVGLARSIAFDRL